MRVLTVNAGSASVKLALFESRDEHLLPLAHATLAADTPATSGLGDFLPATGEDLAVGHRVVHGGAALTVPRRISPEVEAQIAALSPLAPLHNPPALRWIASCRRHFGADLPQVAVFDTGFYRDLPPVAAHYALPQPLAAQRGVRRYGFHGLAHQGMWQRWQALSGGGGSRLLSIQLGGGASITAVREGRPLDTSMGFSPTEGLVMATRCGNLDPSAVTYLQREAGMTPTAVDRLLNEESGLLGVSGVSPHPSELLASDTPAARLALDLYCYRIRHYLGAYLLLLGGTDGITFGGGVGEHLPPIRARVLAGLEWAGITLDEAANQAAVGGEARISAPRSRVEVWVLPVDEAQLIAAATRDLLTDSHPARPPLL